MTSKGWGQHHNTVPTTLLRRPEGRPTWPFERVPYMTGSKALQHVALRIMASRLPPTLPARLFGPSINGAAIWLLPLRSAHLQLDLLTYGATIQAIRAPDRTGALGHIALGFDNFEGYLRGRDYLGATIGRYANRICDARFVLDGNDHHLSPNDGAHCLHGGLRGFDKRVWEIASYKPDLAKCTLRLESPDGDAGFPGRLDVQVAFSVDGDVLTIAYEAICDAPTVISLTNHTYFNLAGSGDILDHELTLAAPRFAPVDDTLIPTGELRQVSGTKFDFRGGARIGEMIDLADPQLASAGGFDHNFALTMVTPAARLRDPESGRILEIETTEPGIQFYSGNFLDGSMQGHGGFVHARYTGLCLETQRYPNSPNEPAFPSAELRPHETFRSRTSYRFTTDR